MGRRQELADRDRPGGARGLMPAECGGVGARSGRKRTRLDAQLPARLRRKLASPTVPSWNQIAAWLRDMDGLRTAMNHRAA